MLSQGHVKEEPVGLSPSDNGRIVVQWRDGGVPQIVQYEPPTPMDAAQFPPMPGKVASNPTAIVNALRDAAESTDPAPVRFATDRIQLRGKNGPQVPRPGDPARLRSAVPLPSRGSGPLPGRPSPVHLGPTSPGFGDP